MNYTSKLDNLFDKLKNETTINRNDFFRIKTKVLKIQSGLKLEHNRYRDEIKLIESMGNGINDNLSICDRTLYDSLLTEEDIIKLENNLYKYLSVSNGKLQLLIREVKRDIKKCSKIISKLDTISLTD